MEKIKDIKLYYTTGTIFFRSGQWITVLDIKGNLHWIDNKKGITQSKEGEVVWLIYSKTGLQSKGESIIPHETATEEDMLRDFFNEADEMKKRE